MAAAPGGAAAPGVELVASPRAAAAAGAGAGAGAGAAPPPGGGRRAAAPAGGATAGGRVDALAREGTPGAAGALQQSGALGAWSLRRGGGAPEPPPLPR